MIGDVEDDARQPLRRVCQRHGAVSLVFDPGEHAYPVGVQPHRVAAPMPLEAPVISTSAIPAIQLPTVTPRKPPPTLRAPRLSIIA